MLKGTQQQKQYKILVIGEICQDVYVFGKVDRVSPEAPVPVIKKTNKTFKHGMSGNVYNNLKSILETASINTCQNNINCLKKIRFIDIKSNYQLMRYDIEKPIEELRIEDVPDENYDAVVISDYNKGFLNESAILEICSKFKQSKIFVDTKKSDLSKFKNCTIKINEKESSEIIWQSLDQSSDIITTLGAEGCEYRTKIYSTKKVDVYDVCGAGDVFLAALVARWIETKDMISAIKTANNCAALSVTKLGCYTIKREEYENLCI